MSKLMLIPVLIWLIPGIREAVRRTLKQKPGLFMIGASVFGAIPLIDINTVGTAGIAWVGTLYFLCFTAIALLLLKLNQKLTPLKAMLFLITPVFCAVFLRFPFQTAGVTFGENVLRYDLILTMFLLGTITERRIPVGLEKKSDRYAYTDVITISLMGISLFFLTAQFSGALESFSTSNAGKQTGNIWYSLFSITVLLGITRWFFFEMPENIFSKFPRLIYIPASSAVIFILFRYLFSSETPSVPLIVLAGLVSALFSGTGGILLTWVICNIIYLTGIFFGLPLLP